jgi:hypothetical protein
VNYVVYSLVREYENGNMPEKFGTSLTFGLGLKTVLIGLNCRRCDRRVFKYCQ